MVFLAIQEVRACSKQPNDVLLTPVWSLAVECAGTESAQQLENDEADIISLDELTLSSSEPCSLPEYGLFGKYDVEGSHGYGAAPGGYGGYAGAAAVGQYGSASPGQYAAAAGAYGTVAGPGGYGATTAAAELLQDSHCKPLVMPGRLLSIGGLANCKVCINRQDRLTMTHPEVPVRGLRVWPRWNPWVTPRGLSAGRVLGLQGRNDAPGWW